MNINLKRLKDVLEQEGIVRVVAYEVDNELAINEQYFCYNKDNGESDLYYIGVTFENGAFKVQTHFCEEDFLNEYDNQVDYVNKVIESMVVLDLNTLKEALEQDGVVNVVAYDIDNEIAINEQYFCYDKDNEESDLYYIGVTFENEGFKVKTHFCEEDFLDEYDNQIDYVNDFIDNFYKQYAL